MSQSITEGYALGRRKTLERGQLTFLAFALDSNITWDGERSSKDRTPSYSQPKPQITISSYFYTPSIQSFDRTRLYIDCRPNFSVPDKLYYLLIAVEAKFGSLYGLILTLDDENDQIFKRFRVIVIWGQTIPSSSGERVEVTIV
jgi:hypothetical protein